MISPPFFVFEGNSLDIFQTLHEIELYLEPIDIQNNEYQIFDNNGNLLLFNIVQKKHKFLGLFHVHTPLIQFSHFIEDKQDIFYQNLQNIGCVLQLSDGKETDIETLKSKILKNYYYKNN